MSDDLTPFAYGAIYGTRSWRVDAEGYLTGIVYRQRWLVGENLATCRTKRIEVVDFTTGRSFTTSQPLPDTSAGFPIEPGHMVECHSSSVSSYSRKEGFGGCGFHAYLEGSRDYKQSGDASGVVALYGRGVVGTRGGRFMKGRIVALFVPRDVDETFAHEQHRRYYFGKDEEKRHQMDAQIRARYAAVRDNYPGIPFYDTWDDMLRVHPTTPPMLKEQPS